MRVQHNLSAMNGQRQLNITDKSLAKVTEKLSSGYKINRAADNAAGLSISEKMRKQIRGLSRASANAEDGISMIQTADGALAEVTDMIQRMNELCIQAANGTNSATDRKYIQDEINQLKTEVDRVAETTKFNELYLLKGDYAGARSLLKKSVKDAVEENPTYTLTEIQELEGIKLIYEDIMVDDVVAIPSSPHGESTNYTDKLAVLADILKSSIVPQAVSQFVSKFPATFGYLDGSTIGIGLKLYDDPATTTLAAVQIRYSSSQTGNGLGYQLSVNMHSLNGDYSLASASIRNELEGTIIHEMMHAFMDEALTYGMTSSDSFPGWFKEGMAQTTVGGCFNGNDWVNGGGTGLHITATSSLADITSIVQSSGKKLSSDTTPARYGTGYLACMYLGYLVNGGGAISESGIRNGLDKMLSEIEGSDSAEPLSLNEVIQKYTSYTGKADFEAKFGDATSAQFIKDLVTKIGDQGTGGVISGFDSTTVLTGAGAQPGMLPDGNLSGIKLFQVDTGTTEVWNTYPAGYKVYTGGGVSTKNPAGYSGASGSGTGTPGTPGGGTGTPGGGSSTPGTPGTGIGIAAGKRATGPITLQIGSDSNVKMNIYIDGMNCKNIGLLEVDVTTEDKATSSIDVVSDALQMVSTQRARLGAYQNRLEHTIKNLDNIVENTTSAESAIRDTDMAEAMVDYSNMTILQQAGQSMLAQSNQLYQGVMNLLAG